MYNNRQEIVGVLEKADVPYKFEGSKLVIKKHLQYEDLYKNVLWLEAQLKLKILHVELKSKTEAEYKTISSKQYTSLNSAMKHLYEYKFGSSYHEICDFIRNPQLVEDELINDVERAFIGVWVQLYKTTYSKNK
ncbi:hypothetical protein NNC19_10685 [Clostridium sp. SHJSY1]|uniref:hypothetical protein n=1 Tax=Clostridium sp. SHJSY1 TaxID=2942483 RepID=UPI002875268E|nr:hypothetical protein [Clostridium sp. SHJSY1]MDS0526148.1 hypothetical protein [Clostridium sp. SHJSY1]